MSNMVIDIENAVVSYREDVALRGVSLRVQSGEFVGIIGPNGAGKTTVLTVINGLGKLLHGSVQVLGHHLTPGNGHSLRKKVGNVPQIQNIDPRMPRTIFRPSELPILRTTLFAKASATDCRDELFRADGFFLGAGGRS